jgi:molybdopterin-guanine dinucleotide biosynthesis protein A
MLDRAQRRSEEVLVADVTGVLLAGGRSSRMGRDKATLAMQGQRLSDRTLAMLRELFAHVLIAGDRPDLATADIPCIPDRFPGSALGGIHGGLAAATTPWTFVTPCDLAYPDAGLARYLLARRHGHDVVVPRTPAGLEPVFALYHRNCLAPIEKLLVCGNYRIYDFYPEVRVNLVDLQDFPGDWQRALTNLNAPEDLRRLDKERS